MRFKLCNRGTCLFFMELACIALVAVPSIVLADNGERFIAGAERFEGFNSATTQYRGFGGFDYEIIQDYAVWEGDILLGKVDAQGNIASQIKSRGLGRGDAFGRWSDGIVPYEAPTTNSAIQQQNIARAIDHWTERTSITFIERTDKNNDQYSNYIRFDSSPSCASYVGMQGGRQSIMVSDACSMGSIVHEIGHALGLFHEHTRADRDNYIQVDWDQIVTNKDINFNILTAGVDNYGPYDYESIMHYGEYFFSATGLKTIIAPNDVEIGQRKELSPLDALAVNMMYATDLAILQPSIIETKEGLEVDVTISNQGAQGARQLQLNLYLAEDSVWQGVSPDSGWQCLSFEAQLTCTLASLAQQTESRFTLQVDPSSGTADDVSILLSSRTRDLDTDNNEYNNIYATLMAANDAGGTTFIELDPSIQTATPESIARALGAAQPASFSSSADKAKAGADGGSLFGLAFLVWAWRKRVYKI